MTAGAAPVRTPLVSVILPTFNRLAFLRQAIESVYAQTLDDWELIIADDGSDDATRRYLQGLERDQSVKLLLLPHSGNPARVRNAALRIARGAYVAFIDSDDLWCPDKLESQAALLRRQTDCQWSYTAFTQIDSTNAVLPGDANRRWLPLEGGIFQSTCNGSASILTSSVFASRELLNQCGAFDERMRSGEDQDLWMRMALRSSVALLNRPMLLRRRHAEQFSDDWEPAYVCRHHSLIKIRKLAGPKWRLLLDYERTRNATAHADTLAGNRRCLEALLVLRHSLAFSWSYAIWWRSLAKVLATSIAPRAVARFRRQHRR
jgi:glycosyltransferase involved in cell wall biosynthesis